MKKYITSLVLLIITGSVNAAVVTYTLNNVFQDNGSQMTGTYSWTYEEGDFENGIGVFNELYVPGYGTELSGLNITIDTESIEISLNQDLHDKNVGVSLKFPTLTPTTGSSINVTLSKWEDFNGGLHSYLFGGVTLVAIPSTPTNLTATDGIEETVNVAWTAVSNATFYNVYRSESLAITGDIIGNLTATNLIDGTVNVDTEYYYRVEACNDIGCSDYSESDSGYIGKVSQPTNPSIIMYLLN